MVLTVSRTLQKRVGTGATRALVKHKWREKHRRAWTARIVDFNRRLLAQGVEAESITDDIRKRRYA